MAALTMGGDPKPKSKKKGKNVDDCTSGVCSPKTRAKMSMKRFNPTKSRYNVSTYEEKPKPKPVTGGLHMNMRDLGNSPGDTQMQKQSNKTAITPGQETEGRKFNTETRKEKRKMRLNRG